MESRINEKRTRGKGCFPWLSRAGLSLFRANRRPVFGIVLLASVVAWICSVAASFGLALDESGLKKMAWAKGSLGPYDAYAGPRAIALDIATNREHSHTVVKWSDAGCGDTDVLTADACSGCNSTSMATTALVIISIILACPSMQIIKNRGFGAEGDSGRLKVTGLLLSGGGWIFMFIATYTFKDSCYEVLPLFNGVEWTLGPGYRLMVVNILVFSLQFIVHLLTPAIRVRAGVSGLGLIGGGRRLPLA